MAKSIRSKFKRKMRSIKRKRVAGRELKKLEATVSKLNSSEVMEIVGTAVENSSSAETMDTGKTSGLNLKTMKRPDGSYPIWLSQRKVKKAKKREQSLNKVKKKKSKRNCK